MSEQFWSQGLGVPDLGEVGSEVSGIEPRSAGFVFVTANVLTLRPAEEVAPGVFSTGRLQLQDACDALGVAAVGLQEARSRTATVRESRSVFMASSGADAHRAHGVELWLSSKLVAS